MEKKELQIELTPEVAEGIYANLAVISGFFPVCPKRK